jgi:hypothetical protein
MKPRRPDWTDHFVRWNWLVQHWQIQALLPGLSAGELKAIKRNERVARQWRRFCCAKAAEEIREKLARWEKIEPRKKPVQLRLPLPEPKEAS